MPTGWQDSQQVDETPINMLTRQGLLELCCGEARAKMAFVTLSLVGSKHRIARTGKDTMPDTPMVAEQPDQDQVEEYDAIVIGAGISTFHRF
jgi:hypothetical protein